MTYQECLLPWCIVQLPEQAIVCRFRRRSDAEGYLKLLNMQKPTQAYQIQFIYLTKLEEP